jgi:two-component sensor histidine kinase
MYDYDRVSHINLRGYLESLMDHILYSYPNHSKELQVQRHIDELYLPTDTMIPLALIMNELLTNSFKYAHTDLGKSGKPPVVKLSITSTDDFVEIDYKDNGKGYPKDVLEGKRMGIGMRLIESLSHQLKGTLTLRSSGGAHTKIEFHLNPGDLGSAPESNDQN